jgi:hypothetical protein
MSVVYSPLGTQIMKNNPQAQLAVPRGPVERYWPHEPGELPEAQLALCDSWCMRARSCDGECIIDVICLTLTGTGRDGEWLRISRWGVHVADVRTVAELAEYVELGRLRTAP